MLKLRKAALALTAPFRAVRKRFNDWVNSSNSMSADWIRRKRMEEFQNKTRKFQ